MKTFKKLLAVIFLLLTVSLYSQVENPISRSNWMIGGSAWAELNSYKSEYDTSKIIGAGIYPSIGYFIEDGLAVGLSIGQRYEKRISDDEYSYSASSIGSLLKYYFPSSFFVGNSFWYSNSKNIQKR